MTTDKAAIEVKANQQLTQKEARMTGEEFAVKQNELLIQLPSQFRSAISYMAYERGHSAGHEEVLGILSGLIFDLLPSIQQFEKDIRSKERYS